MASLVTAGVLAAAIADSIPSALGDMGLHHAPHVLRADVRLRPRQRLLVHVLDWHLVPRDAIPEPYAQHLADVDAVQAEQRDLLRCLASALGLKAVYAEGVTTENEAAFREQVGMLRAMERQEIPILRKQLLDVDALKWPAASRVRQDITDLLEGHLLRLREVGAPGQLLIAGDLAEVLPLDDSHLLAEADPREAGRTALEARDRAIVRNALRRGEPVVIVVLGAGHDLTPWVRQQDPNCGYVRITTREVAWLSGR
jgi:hypothetical protein